MTAQTSDQYTDHEKKERKGKLKKGMRFGMDAATEGKMRDGGVGEVFCCVFSYQN